MILTDEQASGAPRDLPNVPIYTFNLAGYSAGHLADGANRVTFGGLSDACFRLIPVMEGRAAGWPF